MQTAYKPYENAAPDLQNKLDQSRKLAESQELRMIRCPRCGFYMLDVFGYDHYLVRVKCRKCKFNETIDTALFKTIRAYKQQKLSKHRRISSR